MRINDGAVQAARDVLLRVMPRTGSTIPLWAIRQALEDSSPHLMAHERQQTADAHRDAIVNRDTADRLERALEAVHALAEQWESEGESDMAASKTMHDEGISMALLTHGADMVENARHIRNALAAGAGE